MIFKKYLVRFFIGVIILVSFSCSGANTDVKGYLELNLNDTVSLNPFVLTSSPLEVFQVIEKAANDSKIRGIILNIGFINRSRDYLWELRNSLEQFKSSNKKIVAYINNADIDVYMLASVADKIVMDDLGVLTMLGYSAGKGYFSQTLEMLGIGVMELRYFEYKSAAESFTRTNMSEADKKQYSDYLDDIFFHTRSILMEARGWSLDEFNGIINNKFFHSSKSALNCNLVDYVGRNNVSSAILELEDQLILDYFIYGDSNTGIIGRRKYVFAKVSSPQIIAVVYANGETDTMRGMGTNKLVKIINDLAGNDRVKAIVVRINSPGGSAQAADDLAEAILLAGVRKPVVVSMGDVAASGGYWAALRAHHITATPYTITGSIGVIGSWFYDNGFYEKIGISTDVIKRGEHSDLMTGFLVPYRKLTAQEEEQYKNYILDLYGIFIDKVAAGRKMEREKVEALAQGRIYSGKRALEEGLIDSIGSLYDALKTAQSLAGISDNIPVIYREYPEPKLMDRLLGRFSRAQSKTLLDLVLSDSGIQYRLLHNGQIMPILPIEFSVQ